MMPTIGVDPELHVARGLCQELAHARPQLGPHLLQEAKHRMPTYFRMVAGLTTQAALALDSWVVASAMGTPRSAAWARPTWMSGMWNSSRWPGGSVAASAWQRCMSRAPSSGPTSAKVALLSSV